MRILLINKFFYPRGSSKLCFFDTAKLLRKNNNEVSFFAMDSPENLSSNYSKYFVPRIDFDGSMPLYQTKAAGRLLYSSEAKDRISDLINREKPNIAYLHNIHHQISRTILHTLKNGICL